MSSLIDALDDDRTCAGAAEAIGSLYERGTDAAAALKKASSTARPELRGAIETARWRIALDVRYLIEVVTPVFKTWKPPTASGSWRVEAEIVVLNDGTVDLVRLQRGDSEEVNRAVQTALAGAVFEPAKDSDGHPVAVYLDVVVEPGTTAPMFGGKPR